MERDRGKEGTDRREIRKRSDPKIESVFLFGNRIRSGVGNKRSFTLDFVTGQNFLPLYKYEKKIERRVLNVP